MKLKDRLLSAQNIARCLVRTWWRPLICLGFVASVWVNLVIIPWLKRDPIQFDKASLFVTAIVAAFAVREWGKIQGSSD